MQVTHPERQEPGKSRSWATHVPLLQHPDTSTCRTATPRDIRLLGNIWGTRTRLPRMDRSKRLARHNQCHDSPSRCVTDEWPAFKHTISRPVGRWALHGNRTHYHRRININNSVSQPYFITYFIPQCIVSVTFETLSVIRRSMTTKRQTSIIIIGIASTRVD